MPSAHKEHPMMRQLSILDGRTLALAALNGAHYHLDQITRILDSASKPAESWTGKDHPPFLNSQETNQVLWHTRSVFWELVGVFDLMLQWANDRFQLGRKPHKVRWTDDKKLPKKAGVDQDKWDEVRSLIDKAWDSDWYFEVRTYRNFAHRSFLPANAIIRLHGKPQFMLEHAREGQPYYKDVRIQLKEYMDKMYALGTAVFMATNSSTKTATGAPVSPPVPVAAE